MALRGGRKELPNKVLVLREEEKGRWSRGEEGKRGAGRELGEREREEGSRKGRKGKVLRKHALWQKGTY